MADLTLALARAGIRDVESVAASGNILFQAEPGTEAAVASTIKGVLSTAFGIDSFAAVRTSHELHQAILANPYSGVGEDKLVHTVFLENQPSEEQVKTLLYKHEGPEKLAFGRRELYIDYADGVGSSRLTSAFIARHLGCRGTARNVRSMRKILEKMRGRENPDRLGT